MKPTIETILLRLDRRLQGIEDALSLSRKEQIQPVRRRTAQSTEVSEEAKDIADLLVNSVAYIKDTEHGKAIRSTVAHDVLEENGYCASDALKHVRGMMYRSGAEPGYTTNVRIDSCTVRRAYIIQLGGEDT